MSNPKELYQYLRRAGIIKYPTHPEYEEEKSEPAESDKEKTEHRQNFLTWFNHLEEKDKKDFQFIFGEI
jgi:hypothetical protein